jgi:ERCC4-type nuclease
MRRIILVDSREKRTRKVRPLTFPNLPTKTVKLETGDYTIWGYASLVTVEHKRWYDYCQCLSTSSAWKKFRNGQLTRLANYDSSLILVTGNLSNPMSSFTSTTKDTIVSRTAFILSHYKIPVVFASNESLGAKLIEDYLLQTIKEIDCP